MDQDNICIGIQLSGPSFFEIIWLLEYKHDGCEYMGVKPDEAAYDGSSAQRKLI